MHLPSTSIYSIEDDFYDSTLKGLFTQNNIKPYQAKRWPELDEMLIHEKIVA